MSDTSSTVPPVGGDRNRRPSGSSTDSGSTTDVAKEQAAHTGHEAAQAASHVTDTAKSEASDVAREAKSQAKDLFHESKRELTEQASEQQQRVAEGLRSLSEEFRRMAGAGEGGMGSDLVSQAGDKAGSIATWLDQRDPGSLVDEVRDFARHRPGVFIALAAGAGLLVGRLTRSMTDHDDGEQPRPGGANTAPPLPGTPEAPVSAERPEVPGSTGAPPIPGPSRTPLDPSSPVDPTRGQPEVYAPGNEARP